MPEPARPAHLPADASILFIRPDHLGDLLLTAPAVGMLRRALPSARLTYLVGPWGAGVARRGPAVDELLLCPFPGFTRARKTWLGGPYLLLLAEAARLRNRFDAALVLRPDHWWGALLARAAGIPLRLGFDVPECAPFLTHAWREERGMQRAGTVLVERLLELVPTGGQAAEPRAEPFMIHPEEHAYAGALLRESDSRPDQPLIAIHPGSGAALKLWPAERWIALGRALVARSGARLLVSGSEAERPLVERIAAGIGPSAAGLAGRTTLGQLAALFQRVEAVIGPDSGPLHLAASVGTPTLRLFGPTDPGRFMPEHLPDQRALTFPLPCRPCGHLERPPCGARVEPACLLGIGVEEVLGALCELLDTRTARRRSDPAGRPGVS